MPNTIRKRREFNYLGEIVHHSFDVYILNRRQVCHCYLYMCINSKFCDARENAFWFLEWGWLRFPVSSTAPPMCQCEYWCPGKKYHRISNESFARDEVLTWHVRIHLDFTKGDIFRFNVNRFSIEFYDYSKVNMQRFLTVEKFGKRRQ